MRLGLLTLLAAMLASPARGDGEPGKNRPVTLYYFFAPSGGGSLEGAKRVVRFAKARLGLVKVRPVMLLESFGAIRALEESSPLTGTLRELQTLGTLDLPLYDEEGLALAERWGVKSLPSSVLVSGSRAHLAIGPVVPFEELLECDR